MVSRNDDHHRFRVQPLHIQRGKPDGCGSIPSERLKKQIGIGKLRELLPDQVGMRPASHHQDPRPRKQDSHTLNSRLKKGVSPDQSKKRLRVRLRTQRPESLSPSAGEYNSEGLGYPHDWRAFPSLSIATAIVILEPDDVIFLEVGAALNLNDGQRMRAGVFDPVGRSRRHEG